MPMSREAKARIQRAALMKKGKNPRNLSEGHAAGLVAKYVRMAGDHDVVCLTRMFRQSAIRHIQQGNSPQMLFYRSGDRPCLARVYQDAFRIRWGWIARSTSAGAQILEAAVIAANSPLIPRGVLHREAYSPGGASYRNQLVYPLGFVLFLLRETLATLPGLLACCTDDGVKLLDGEIPTAEDEGGHDGL